MPGWLPRLLSPPIRSSIRKSGVKTSVFRKLVCMVFGITPMTVNVSPLSASVRPTTLGSRPKRRSQKPSPSSTTPGAPAFSSSGPNARPTIGCLPSVRNRPEVTRRPLTRSGRLDEPPESAPELRM